MLWTPEKNGNVATEYVEDILPHRMLKAVLLYFVRLSY